MTRYPSPVSLFVLLLALIGMSQDLSAQREWPATWIQVATGLAGGTGAWGEQADGRVALSGMVAVAYRPSLQLSLGYARYGFDCTGGPGCGLNSESWTVTSLRGQVEYRFGDLNGMRPWIRGGLANNKIQFDSPIADDPDRSFGFVAGAGFEISVGGASSVLIGGRGERFSSQLPNGDDIDVGLWVADFAFRFRVY